MANKVGILVDLNSKYLMNMVKVFRIYCVVIVLFAQLDYSVYYSVAINSQIREQMSGPEIS